MALKSLEAVHKNPTIETSKQITLFINYSTTHPYTVIEYRKSGMVLHIYSDASYVSDTEA